MKRNFLLFSLGLLSASGYAQLNIQSGATFFIQSGATVTVQGDVTSNADIQGTGLLLLKGSSLQTINMNGFSVQNVQIDNTNNIALAGSAIIGSSLVFTNGKVQLNNFDLSLASAATLSGFDNTRYFVTNGTGRLVKNSLGAVPFVYPVGFDGSSYNPLTVTQNGTVDDIGVRCLQSVLQNGTSGSAFVKEVVDASWAVTEATAGGSNLAMTSSWNGSDELPGFNRNKTGISYYDGVGWDMTNSQTAAAVGTGPYTITRSNVSNLANGGIFAVGTRPVLTQLRVSPKVILQGGFSAGLMRDNLRTAVGFPTTEPYTSITTFTHSGSGGGETIPVSLLGGTGTPANDLVDWIFVQLHRSSDGAVVATRSVLVERDGDVFDLDGTNTKINYVNFAGEIADNYYVSIRHRNHLGVRSANLLALSRTVNTAIDFTASLANALAVTGTPTTNDAMATLPGGLFGMWGGNARINTPFNFISYTGSQNDQQALLNIGLGGNKSNTINGYNIYDLNLNGIVSYTGSGNDQALLLNIVLGGNKSRVIYQAPF